MKMKFYFVFLFSCYLISSQSVAQNMEVSGQMKVKQMAVDNTAQELVVQKNDGTLAKRTLASLVSGTNAVDSVKSFQRDMELLRTLCSCPDIEKVSKFIIERLEAHGYTRDDMISAGLSEYTLDAYKTVYDYDGNPYTPININGHIWLKEPLRTTHFLDGTAITFASSNASWTSAGSSDTLAYCWPNGDAANAAGFGALYNYHVIYADFTKKVCPMGYRLPTQNEWVMDRRNADNITLGAKDTSPEYWNAPNEATNASGMSVRGAGTRDANGAYVDFKKLFVAYYSLNTSNLSIFTVESVNTRENLGYNGRSLTRSHGLSVRCKKID